MVRESDVILNYITHSWGGVAQFVEYAKRQEKEVINLAQKNIWEIFKKYKTETESVSP